MIPLIFALVIGGVSVWRFCSAWHDLVEVDGRRVPYYPPLPERDGPRVTSTTSDSWFVEYFQDFPASPLKEKYPEQYRMAMTVLRFRALEVQREHGMISEEAYASELEAIAAEIPIEDLLK